MTCAEKDNQAHRSGREALPLRAQPPPTQAKAALRLFPLPHRGALEIIMKTENKRWERSATRENKRRTDSAPLLAFAGLIPLTTAQEQQRKTEAMLASFWKQLEEHRRLAELDWPRFRELCAVEAPEQMPALDARFAKYRTYAPNEPSYRCDFWYQRWHELQKAKGRCQPGTLFCTCRERWESVSR